MLLIVLMAKKLTMFTYYSDYRAIIALTYYNNDLYA